MLLPDGDPPGFSHFTQTALKDSTHRRALTDVDIRPGRAACSVIVLKRATTWPTDRPMPNQTYGCQEGPFLIVFDADHRQTGFFETCSPSDIHILQSMALLAVGPIEAPFPIQLQPWSSSANAGAPAPRPAIQAAIQKFPHVPEALSSRLASCRLQKLVCR